MDLGYVAIGFMTIVFIFQLILLWYMWWIYTQMVENYDDVEEMIVDIYTLEVAEARKDGIDAVMKLPKRVRAKMAKKQDTKV